MFLSSELDKGTFEGRKVPENEGCTNDAWWDKKWVPFAEDSCADLICLDLNPGPKGNPGQLIWMEQQDGTGPIAEPETNFLGWLSNFLERLQDNELIVDEEGFIGDPIVHPMVEAKVSLPELSYEESDLIEDAVKAGDLDLLKALVDSKGPDISLVYERPLLSVIAEHGKQDFAEFILSKGGDVNIGQNSGLRTPLFRVCWGMGAKIPLVEFLLDKGADVNALTAYDGGPIHSAIMWEHKDIVDLFTKRGADLDMEDANGRAVRDLL